MKKLSIILLITLLLITANIYAVADAPDEIHMLIIYKEGTTNYLDAYQNYKQSLIPYLKISTKGLAGLTSDLSKYQAIYLDKSIKGEENFANHKQSIINYVKNGGHLFLEDSFYEDFPLDFLGASQVKKVESFPLKLDFPQTNLDLKGLQDTLKYFYKDVMTYYDKGTLENLDKGYSIIPTTALSIAKDESTSFYALNSYGKGTVLLSNSFLPNYDYITGFDLVNKSDNQKYFNYGFSTANYLYRNQYISYISKTLYGYSIEKVLGSYGRPAMAWQNHFEVGSALRDDSMIKWIDILKEYDQIPSYSLARSLFEWGTWKESINLHKNIGTTDKPMFAGVETESHYSSGEHLKTPSDYLALNQYLEKKDLASTIDLPYRAYPTLADFNGDGNLDIVSGSSDGYLYLFKGKTYKSYNEKMKLIDAVGNPIKVDSYSAPVFVDVNGDGKLDLIVGSGSGLVDLYINNGDNTFRKSTSLVSEKGFKNTTPTIADIDGDGVLDLVVGEASGNIHVYKGSIKNASLSFSKTKVTLKTGKENAHVGKYPAVAIRDLDGDGVLDMIVGDSTGYLKRYTISYPNIDYHSYMEGESLNLKGDRRLWGGYYSVPVIRDIDGDGRLDLLVGQLEFGMPVAIDSDIFPYKEDLKRSLQAAKDNYIDIYPHVYFQPYKASSQEEQELALHKEAFKSYGIAWKDTGVNQHTWNINNIYPTQSLYNEEKSGIKWNSGFRPSLVAGEPTLSRDYIWTMPFKLSSSENYRDFTLFNPAPNIPILEKAYTSLGELDMPITYFYHMEYGVNTEAGLKGLRQKAQTLEDLRNKYDYNFMMEPQMFDAFEANQKASISIRKDMAIDKYQYIITTKVQNIKDNPYANTVGIKMELGESLKARTLATDSNIYYRKDSTLYIGLSNTTKVYLTKEKDPAHIIRVNGPIDLVKKENSTIKDIKFNYQGLQQIKIYAPQGLDIIEGDFDIKVQGDYVVLTRYGGETTLSIRY